MTVITIAADDKLATALQAIAEQRAMTVEAVAREVLSNYVRAESPRPRRYSFIGIGHSRKGTLSTQVEAILEQAADRREGWSLR